MGIAYQSVQWNRQKWIYDGVLVGGVGAFLFAFGAVTKMLFPLVTDEILVIRGTGVTAFALLHGVLAVGPLCRLQPKFLPLLYNRRHAGVTLFLLALIHAVLVIITYHAGGDTFPLLAIFVAGPFHGTAGSFPFQPCGFLALLILFLMAATSHDFWLANLTAPVWKALHMLVYVAYALLVLHVAFGALLGEVGWVYAVALGLGLMLVLGLHLTAALQEMRTDRAHLAGSKVGELPSETPGDGFLAVCDVAEIPENRARVVCVGGERVAVFKYDGRISAVSNVCQHQNGPLGEGKIVHGCITCPWHGYQYLPATGASPPPFTEKVPTFNVRVVAGRVFLHPQPNPPGTRTEPASIDSGIGGIGGDPVMSTASPKGSAG